MNSGLNWGQIAIILSAVGSGIAIIVKWLDVRGDKIALKVKSEMDTDIKELKDRVSRLERKQGKATRLTTRALSLLSSDHPARPILEQIIEELN